MARSRRELEKEILELSSRERAELVHRIITSLEPISPDDVETDWMREAEERYQAYRKGLLEGRPAEEVFESARKRLK